VELNKALKTLGKNVAHRWPNINNGGCGVFAGYVGRELIRLGVETRIIVASGSVDDMTEEEFDNIQNSLAFRANIEEWNSNGVYFSHIGVEFYYNKKLWHYDTNGVHKACDELDGMPLYPGRLSVGEAIHIAEDSTGWNCMFDRSEIPRVNFHIRSFFKNANLLLTQEPVPYTIVL